MAYKTELDYINEYADFIVRAIDVGSGDCLLIQTGVQNVLIDTGPPNNCHLLTAALKKYGATHLHKIIITHPHIDHQGNLLSLLNDSAFTIDAVYTNGVDTGLNSTQYQYKSMLGSKYKTLKQDNTLNFGNGVTWTTLWPHDEFITEIQRRTNNDVTAKGGIAESAPNDDDGKGSTDGLEANSGTYSMNNASIVGKIVKGDFSMLFTGDAGAKVWNTLKDTKQAELLCKVYKAAHHSQNAANIKNVILNTIKPETVIITAGNHQEPYPATAAIEGKTWSSISPCIQTIDKLVQGGIDVNRIYSTRHHGDITIGIFGSEYTIYPATQDYLWAKRWLDQCNKYIVQEGETRQPYAYKTSSLDDPSLFRLTMINVGVGDAFLIRAGNQTTLIDCGNWHNEYDNKGKLFQAALKRYGVTKIDKIIITHPHGDHQGGLGEILKNNNDWYPYAHVTHNILDKNGNVTVPGTVIYHCGCLAYGTREQQFTRFCSETYRGEGKGIPFETLYRDDNDMVSSSAMPRTIELGGGAKFYVYGPSRDFMDNAVTYYRWTNLTGVKDTENEGGNNDEETEALDNVNVLALKKLLLIAKTALDTTGVSPTDFENIACHKIAEHYDSNMPQNFKLLALLTDIKTLKTTTGLASGETPENKAATEACGELITLVDTIQSLVQKIRNKTSEVAENGVSYTSYVSEGFTKAVEELSKSGITVTGTLSNDSSEKLAKGVTAALTVSDFSSSSRGSLAKVMTQNFIEAIATLTNTTTVTAETIDQKISSFTVGQIINMAHAFVSAMSYLKSSPKTGTTTAEEQKGIATAMADALLSTKSQALTDAVTIVAHFRGKRFNPSIADVDITENPTKTGLKYSVNDLSITGKIVYKNISILMTGDCDVHMWDDIIDHYGTANIDESSPKSLRCTILKSPHHTSNHNNTTSLLDNTKPKTVIASCAGYFQKYPTVNLGKNELPEGAYGTLRAFTPRPEFFLSRLFIRLKISRDQFFCTRFNHDVTITTDGNNYWVTPDLDDRGLTKEKRFLRRYRQALKALNVPDGNYWLKDDFWPDNEDQ